MQLWILEMDFLMSQSYFHWSDTQKEKKWTEGRLNLSNRPQFSCLSNGEKYWPQTFSSQIRANFMNPERNYRAFVMLPVLWGRFFLAYSTGIGWVLYAFAKERKKNKENHQISKSFFSWQINNSPALSPIALRLAYLSFTWSE